MKFGTLTLIPTPIDEIGDLDQTAKNVLLKACSDSTRQSHFAIEDLKPGRRRWLAWGLPREQVDSFVLYNEHTAKTASIELLNYLKAGDDVYIMSDGGLPAFYDPGIELVDGAHLHGIKVTATPFFNSVSLALALSGISHKRFIFEGFLPVDKSERSSRLKNIKNNKTTTIIMDTPYRLERLLDEVKDFGRTVFVAMDLNRENEELMRGTPSELLKKIKDFKREFIMVIAP